ncbi:MAG: hypothetical protein QJR02_08245 [Sinobacteraceae bacterium]|nr:hypothetical protein [Nevskiaceae bacterium]
MKILRALSILVLGAAGAVLVTGVVLIGTERAQQSPSEVPASSSPRPTTSRAPVPLTAVQKSSYEQQALAHAQQMLDDLLRTQKDYQRAWRAADYAWYGRELKLHAERIGITPGYDEIPSEYSVKYGLCWNAKQDLLDWGKAAFEDASQHYARMASKQYSDDLAWCKLEIACRGDAQCVVDRREAEAPSIDLR